MPEEDSASSSSIHQRSFSPKSDSPKFFPELDKKRDFLSTLEEFADISKEILKEQESIISQKASFAEQLSPSLHLLSSSTYSGRSSDENKDNYQLNSSFNYGKFSKSFNFSVKSDEIYYIFSFLIIIICFSKGK